MSRALYNEIDPVAAHTLRHLIASGVIAPGEVAECSIKDLTVDDLRGYTQIHFFAGIGALSVAARLAGWPDDRPLWTGSCPCQPFSAAGKGQGRDDPRHLWPDFHRLISAARNAAIAPPAIVGEQVAGKAGYDWFDGVRADLAREGFAGRVVDFPACSIDAPHQRNRLYWVAVEHATGIGRRQGRAEHELRSMRPAIAGADAPGVGFMADDARQRRSKAIGKPGHRVAPNDKKTANRPEHVHGHDCNLADSASSGRDSASHGRVYREAQGERPWHGEPERLFAPYRPNGTYWSDAEWIVCHDDKARRAKPGLRFLVDGLPGRIDLWRLGGNAIVPQAAAEVLAALREVLDMEAAFEAE